MDNIQLAITLLKNMMLSDRLGAEGIDQAIEILEDAKNSLNVENEEAVDKIDEMQDYLEYLLVTNEAFNMPETKQEIAGLIETLQKLSQADLP